jgi:hypothetical protein
VFETILYIFNKSLPISVGPYKAASQNLTLNLNHKTYFNFKVLGFGYKS